MLLETVPDTIIVKGGPSKDWVPVALGSPTMSIARRRATTGGTIVNWLFGCIVSLQSCTRSTSFKAFVSSLPIEEVGCVADQELQTVARRHKTHTQTHSIMANIPGRRIT
ncbi:hypothetical protein L1887_36461 [Cichorium endivia]|nr:hypothetical protein L1887_36461 [Cichorium endivia]